MRRCLALCICTYIWVSQLACTVAGAEQIPLVNNCEDSTTFAPVNAARPTRRLLGRFLQISDLHPDPFYKVNSASDTAGACHRGTGPAGYYGAEKTECDAPFSLINATFQWIEDNLKDTIDFVVWTGDSARHDNDEEHPRSEEQVLGLNRKLVEKFREVFGRTDSHRPEIGPFQIPIVPTFGNNDILPHNIFSKGPNTWTKRYSQLWGDIIPEEQRHAFGRGGWFYVEVIPNKLAVFSLNTLYFFDSNNAVDGCASPTQPGYEHMEWLRIQLAFLRQRGMKAILSGHVPPARSREKSLWDETCWQKYAIWTQQYRDIIVGSMFGHMNVEHFLLQDFHDIDYEIASGLKPHRTIASKLCAMESEDASNDVNIKVNAPNYINSLRQIWSKLPTVPRGLRSNASQWDDTVDNNKNARDQRNFYDEVGGRYAERFSVSMVAASVVPNYFPTLRVYHYNISGLENIHLSHDQSSLQRESLGSNRALDDPSPLQEMDFSNHDLYKTRPKKPRFTVPDPPSKRSPPGPAYSPQTFSWLGYTQYFANLTTINANVKSLEHDQRAASLGYQDPQKHDFDFEVEYDTRDSQDIYPLEQGLTVNNWVKFAATVGEWKSRSKSSDTCDAADTLDNMGLLRVDNEFNDDYEDDDDNEDGGEDEEVEVDEVNEIIGVTADFESIEESKMRFDADLEREHVQKKHKKKGKKKKKPSKKRLLEIEQTWLAFTSRAVVGTLSRDELREKFG